MLYNHTVRSEFGEAGTSSVFVYTIVEPPAARTVHKVIRDINDARIAGKPIQGHFGVLSHPTLLSFALLSGTLHLRHLALGVELLAEALHLLRQGRVRTHRTRRIAAIQNLTSKDVVEVCDERLPAVGGLAVDEVLIDPDAFLVDVRLYLLAEADAGVAANLLGNALVEAGDGLLVVPVLGRRVPEDDLPAVFGGKTHE